jgi:hypothetical protein
MQQGCRKEQAGWREKICGRPLQEEKKWKSLLFSTPHPPPPVPLKAATGAGFANMFAKSACKILSPKGLEVKILKTKYLTLPRRISLRRCRHEECQKSGARGKVIRHRPGKKSCGYPITYSLTAEPLLHHRGTEEISLRIRRSGACRCRDIGATSSDPEYGVNWLPVRTPQLFSQRKLGKGRLRT